jgi:hypothetical protein
VETIRRFAASGVVAAVALGLLVAVGGTAQAAADPGTYTTLTATRVLDTRIGLGAPKAAVPGLGAISVPVAGRAGVPATGVGAVQLTVTVTGTQATGFLTVWPHGTARPQASTLNFVSGITVANSATVMVPAGGALDFFNGSHAGVQVIADVSGYYASGATTAPGTFAPLTPARVLDTRTGGGALQPQATLRVPIAGVGGVPATGAGAVVLNLTATGPTATGFLTAFGTGQVRPGTSTLNFVTGSTVANQAIVPLGADGAIQIFNGSATGTVHAIADVAGYFRAGTPTVAGTYLPLAPTRILDTRQFFGYPGQGNDAGPTTTLFAGEGGVPINGVTAVALNVTVANTTATGNLTVYAGGTDRPGTSNLNWVAGQTVADLVIAPVGADGKVLFTPTTSGQFAVIADVVGYVRGASPVPVPTLERPSLPPAIHDPRAVAVNAAGDTYIASEQSGLSVLTHDGELRTVVPGAPAGGNGLCPATGDGDLAANGCVWAADVKLAPTGEIYIADPRNARVRRIANDGTISTVAGNGTQLNCGNGDQATDACVAPDGVAVDTAGRIYIADSFNQNVRRVETNGFITRYAGLDRPAVDEPAFCPPPREGNNASGQCVGDPTNVAVDAQGTLYVSSAATMGGVFRVDTRDDLFVVVGNGRRNFGDGGPAALAGVLNPTGLLLDHGNLYVAQDGLVRRIDTFGDITTVAGSVPFFACTAPGISVATASCLDPTGLAVTAAGTFVLADRANRFLWTLTLP